MSKGFGCDLETAQRSSAAVGLVGNEMIADKTKLELQSSEEMLPLAFPLFRIYTKVQLSLLC